MGDFRFERLSNEEVRYVYDIMKSANLNPTTLCIKMYMLLINMDD